MLEPSSRLRGDGSTAEFEGASLGIRVQFPVAALRHASRFSSEERGLQNRGAECDSRPALRSRLAVRPYRLAQPRTSVSRTENAGANPAGDASPACGSSPRPGGSRHRSTKPVVQVRFLARRPPSRPRPGESRGEPPMLARPGLTPGEGTVRVRRCAPEVDDGPHKLGRDGATPSAATLIDARRARERARDRRSGPTW